MSEFAVMPLIDYAKSCDKIREITNTDKTIKSGEFSEKIESVFEAGKKADNEAFWDEYQKNGTRKNYDYAFSYEGWTANNFLPKYDIVPTAAAYCFAYCGMSGDLVELLDKCNVKLDTSKATQLQYLFVSNGITHIPTISTVSETKGLTLTFGRLQKLRTIDRLILKSDGSQTFNRTFENDYDLANIVIEGTIGQNGFNTQWSTKLNKASIISIINCLSTTTSGLTVTLSKEAVNKAFETSEGANDGTTSTEWTNIIGNRSNWTIGLA